MDDYEKLRQILHKHPTGAPPSAALQGILRTPFTPREVYVAAAMRVVEGVATVGAERCIGCGLCASGCEQQAMRMLPRPQPLPEPPETVTEAGMRIAVEKGRLDEFLPLLER